MKQCFDDCTGDVLSPRGLIHFEKGVLIMDKEKNEKTTWGGKREGAGRKPKEGAKAITISFCLLPEQKAKLDKAVQDSGLRRSEYLIKKLELL